MKLLDSQVDPKMWNLVSKCILLRFCPPEESVFELITNLKFSFSESGPRSVHIPPKPIFLFKFSKFYSENARNQILSSNSAGKILKMAIKSEALGLCNQHFCIFLLSMRQSNGEYFKDFKIFDLVWIWWIWLEWLFGCSNFWVKGFKFLSPIWWCL